MPLHGTVQNATLLPQQLPKPVLPVRTFSTTNYAFRSICTMTMTDCILQVWDRTLHLHAAAKTFAPPMNVNSSRQGWIELVGKHILPFDRSNTNYYLLPPNEGRREDHNWRSIEGDLDRSVTRC